VSGPSSHHPPVAARTASEASELRSDKDDLTLPQRLTNHGSRAGYPRPRSTVEPPEGRRLSASWIDALGMTTKGEPGRTISHRLVRI
jgi:hypothetical protein